MASQVDEHTKAILITNPSNPCGSNYSAEHLADIVGVARYHVRMVCLYIVTMSLSWLCVVCYPEHMASRSSLMRYTADWCSMVPLLPSAPSAVTYLCSPWEVRRAELSSLQCLVCLSLLCSMCVFDLCVYSSALYKVVANAHLCFCCSVASWKHNLVSFTVLC